VIFIAICAGFGAYCTFLAQQPDYEIVFTREVNADAPQTAIETALWSLNNWPQWFFITAQVQRVDLAGNAFPMKDQILVPGAWIRFWMDPKKGKYKKFELLAVVKEYTPLKQMTLRILQDTSGRLTRLFSLIEWKIELIPASPGHTAQIRGTQTVRTRHWRSRLFGRLAERIYMNQVFYPDLMTLGKITLPTYPNPFGPESQ
jgi:hypothetical protein